VQVEPAELLRSAGCRGTRKSYQRGGRDAKKKWIRRENSDQASYAGPAVLCCRGSVADRYNAGMHTPQAGIFALGTSSHAYLEFDLLDAKKCVEFASAISAIREPRTTTGGVNFVIGFRPELWRELVPGDAPGDVKGFNNAIEGTEGFVMPATQHDALV